MIPSKRFILLFIIGTVPLSLSGLFPLLLWFGLIYDCLLFAAGLIDFIITPKPKDLILSRYYEDKLSLGEKNPITIRVKNRSRFWLVLTIR